MLAITIKIKQNAKKIWPVSSNCVVINERNKRC